jgi:site-specific DNA-methyltransferase (adenine-specific)
MVQKNIVHLIDCMEFMKTCNDKQYDLAITDPPYGIGETQHGDKHKKIYWNNESPKEEYFIELHRISKNQIIWGVNYYAKYIPSSGRIIHNKLGKDIGRRLTSPTFSDCDIASQSFNNLVKMFSYTWIGNVQGNEYHIDWKNENKIHPQMKPVALYKWLLKNYAKPGQIIFDSHVGSGSSRIACYDMGFDFEGTELDLDYFNAQEERFKNHISQKDLFEKDDIQKLIYKEIDIIPNQD